MNMASRVRNHVFSLFILKGRQIYAIQSKIVLFFGFLFTWCVREFLMNNKQLKEENEKKNNSAQFNHKLKLTASFDRQTFA